jgi:hypothetical protein
MALPTRPTRSEPARMVTRPTASTQAAFLAQATFALSLVGGFWTFLDPGLLGGPERCRARREEPHSSWLQWRCLAAVLRPGLAAWFLGRLGAVGGRAAVRRLQRRGLPLLEHTSPSVANSGTRARASPEPRRYGTRRIRLSHRRAQHGSEVGRLWNIHDAHRPHEDRDGH